jgi:asparagine synthase (glutamine-hydrolysing)
MSMGASLEARVPLLDLEVLSLAKSLPRAWKVDTSRTKKILKDAFADLIPYTVLHQPKRGWFSPGAKWLRRPGVDAAAGL